MSSRKYHTRAEKVQSAAALAAEATSKSRSRSASKSAKPLNEQSTQEKYALAVQEAFTKIMGLPSIRSPDVTVAYLDIMVPVSFGLLKLKTLRVVGRGKEFVGDVAALCSARARQLNLAAEMQELFSPASIATLGAVGITLWLVNDLARLAEPVQWPSKETTGDIYQGVAPELMSKLREWLAMKLLPQNAEKRARPSGARHGAKGK